MMLKSTATASLAFPSAVSVSARVQSQRLHFCAPLGNKFPQYGHGVVFGPPDCCSVEGASVYSTFVKLNLTRRPRFVKKTCAEDRHGACKYAGLDARYRVDEFTLSHSSIHRQTFAYSRNWRLGKCVERFADRKPRPRHENRCGGGYLDARIGSSGKARCRSFAGASRLVLA